MAETLEQMKAELERARVEVFRLERENAQLHSSLDASRDFLMAIKIAAQASSNLTSAFDESTSTLFDVIKDMAADGVGVFHPNRLRRDEPAELPF